MKGNQLYLLEKQILIFKKVKILVCIPIPGKNCLKQHTYILKYVKCLTCFRHLKRIESESRPCIFWSRILFESDFELPGFPTRNRGIRSSTQTTIMKKFSLKARFWAILSLIFKSFKKAIWHLSWMRKTN